MKIMTKYQSAALIDIKNRHEQTDISTLNTPYRSTGVLTIGARNDPDITTQGIPGFRFATGFRLAKCLRGLA